MMPFVVLGALPVANRRTMAGGFDYNMIVLLLLQPAYPLAGTFGNSLATAVAVVVAPVVALVAFRFAFPADARRRMDMLIAMMVHELQDMAATPDAPAHRTVWRARLYHRMLRLVRWTDKAGERRISAADGSLAVMQLGNAILRMQELLREPAPAPRATRSIDTALRRMRKIGQEPERAGRALERAARRLARTAPAEADLIGDAAGGLAANLDFFRRAGGGPAD